MNISALRTYALLQSALFQLLTEMPFEKITLTRLCARSMVPRSTFYRYFEDKYDLLRYCLRRFFEESRLDEDVIYLKNQESTQAFIAKVITVISRRRHGRSASSRRIRISHYTTRVYSRYRLWLTYRKSFIGRLRHYR